MYGIQKDLVLINKKKKKNERTRNVVDFIVLTNHRVKIKESEKMKKYLDLNKELKRLSNMRLTMILIVV